MKNINNVALMILMTLSCPIIAETDMPEEFSELFEFKERSVSIKDINAINLIKSDMLKKIIYNREIEVVKIGKKNFISRSALIDYLTKNTFKAVN